ncbi:MAG TPA: hypothetical protein PL159_01220, partial [Candidatus Paceibacterota bacterium]|nr:hypothetical protein [Candidatus Paceibacterota bacterium]
SSAKAIRAIPKMIKKRQPLLSNEPFLVARAPMLPKKTKPKPGKNKSRIETSFPLSVLRLTQDRKKSSNKGN